MFIKMNLEWNDITKHIDNLLFHLKKLIMNCLLVQSI